MTQFKAEVFQNQFLPLGAKEVHAIMTVTASGGTSANPSVTSGSKVFGIICDVSGSMGGEKLQAAKGALVKLVNLMPADVHFFIITGSDKGHIVFPALPASGENKQRALEAIRGIQAVGATFISSWLLDALQQFERFPKGIRQALLLTDGENDEADRLPLDAALRRCEGRFQCDCRGVGTDWKVEELRKIAGLLLGTTDIIRSPELIEADFRAILEKAISKQVSDVALRLWHPQGARVLFCKEVSPQIVDLTSKAKPLTAQILEYPTGSWGGNESRDFHFSIEVRPGAAGDEMLAGRASLVVTNAGVENKVSEARILALWTDDDAKSTRIEHHVAHYTGQADLAESIQQGLEARAKGDDDAATALLGKAVKIAHESGNEGTAKLLKSVVDVVDPSAGTVRLKKSVSKEDEMALETRSTKTKRLQKS